MKQLALIPLLLLTGCVSMPDLSKVNMPRAEEIVVSHHNPFLTLDIEARGGQLKEDGSFTFDELSYRRSGRVSRGEIRVKNLTFPPKHPQ